MILKYLAKIVFCGLCGWGLAPLCNAQVQSANVAQSSELTKILAESKAFVDAFNRGDAKAVASLWTEDGDFVDEAGQRYSGRDEIEKAYVAFFASNPRSQIRILVDSLRLLNENTAIEDGRSVVDGSASGAPGHGKYTAVHVKVNGKWHMATVRESRVEIVSNYELLSELEWLVGTWVGEEQGAKSETTCRWIANKNFIERRYSVTALDGTVTSGVQIIGWNPAAGYVQSWSFHDDGGHSVGVWSKQADGWSIDVTGVTGNGESTRALNLMRRLDDNGYSWKSIRRSIEGMSLPDTEEIVLRRGPASR